MNRDNVIRMLDEICEKAKPRHWIKYIALTHTPSTHIICIPVKMVRALELEEDNTVQIELDNDKIIIKKVKE